jgi:hypothetical protein
MLPSTGYVRVLDSNQSVKTKLKPKPIKKQKREIDEREGPHCVRRGGWTHDSVHRRCQREEGGKTRRKGRSMRNETLNLQVFASSKHGTKKEITAKLILTVSTPTTPPHPTTIDKFHQMIKFCNGQIPKNNANLFLDVC